MKKLYLLTPAERVMGGRANKGNQENDVGEGTEIPIF
jgi:hypothetical protein